MYEHPLAYLQQAGCILRNLVLQEGRNCILASASHPCPDCLVHLQKNKTDAMCSQVG